MASVKKKQIKPLVSILSLEPKDIERFWPLAEFMVAEALAFSGKYADSAWVLEQLKKDMMQCWIMFGSFDSFTQWSFTATNKQEGIDSKKPSFYLITLSDLIIHPFLSFVLQL